MNTLNPAAACFQPCSSLPRTQKLTTTLLGTRSAVTTGTSNAGYPDVPLDPKQGEIRVLDLRPGGTNEELCGDLRNVSLNTSPHYEALSYTWGETGDEIAIRLNGHVYLAVRPDLRDALRRLRSSATVCTLWIDAICINQTDVNEQSQQVALMQSVYSKAACVLIWLGEYDGAQDSDNEDMRLPHFHFEGRRKVLNERGRRFGQALECALTKTKPRWHDRSWVVQEFLSAGEAYFCLGPVRVKFEFSILQDFSKSREPLPAVKLLHERMTQVLRLKPTSDGAPGFAKAAAEMATFTTTRLSDRVFGMLGIVDPRESGMVPADADLAPEEVFAAATFASIKVQGNLKILSQVILREGSNALPSWALDFAEPGNRRTGYSKISDFIVRQSHWPILNLSQDHKTLYVRGAFVGRLVTSLPFRDVNLKLYTCLSDGQLSMLARLLETSTFGVHGHEHQPTVKRLVELYCLERPGLAPSAIADLLGVKSVNVNLLDALDLWDAAFHPSVGNGDTVWKAREEQESGASVGNDVDESEAEKECEKLPKSEPEKIRLCEIEKCKINRSEVKCRKIARHKNALRKFESIMEERHKIDLCQARLCELGLPRTERHKIQLRYRDDWKRDRPLDEMISAFMEYARIVSQGVSFFSTPSGLIGISPMTAQQGDVVAFLEGAQTPVILRPYGQTQACNENAYSFNGFAYVHRLAECGFDEKWLRSKRETIALR